MAYDEGLENVDSNALELYEGEAIEDGSGGFLEGLLEQGNIVDQLENNADATAKTLELFGKAKASMAGWLKKYKNALNLAKLIPTAGDTEITEKNFPFEGASLAMLPFVTEAMIDFNSRSAPELVWSEHITAMKVYGGPKKQPMKQAQSPEELQGQQQQQAQVKESDDLKLARSERASKYMQYQLSEKMVSWRDEQDKNLMVLPCVGTSYKLSYFDYDKGEVQSDLYLANEIIFDHGCSNFRDAKHVFIELDLTRNEVITFIRGIDKWDLKEDDLEEEVDSFKFIKAFTLFDIDGDGLKEPYCAIICDTTSKIVALYPYFAQDTINRNEKDEIISVDTIDCITQYKFLPDPAGGPMGLGWGILFGPMFSSINASLRQLIDAGTFQNVAGSSGFITTDLASGLGNSTQSGPIDLALGMFSPINTRGGNLRDSIFQPPAAGPSPVLFQLLEYLIQSARGMTNASVNIESMPGEAAALYLARLKQGLKVPNSIIMRIYSAAKQEKQKIGLLNYRHFDDEAYNKVLDEDVAHSMESDFNPDDCDIRLAVDPAQGSDIERIQLAETVLQEAKTQPQQVLNLRLAYVDWLKAMGHPDVEAMAPEPDPNAVDPMQQMMVAQMQMEAELKQKGLQIREQKMNIETHALALKGAAQAQELEFESAKKEREVYEVESQVAINIATERKVQAEAEAQEIENDLVRSGVMGELNDGQTSANS